MSVIHCDAVHYEPSLGSVLFVSEVASGPNVLYFPTQDKSGLPIHRAPAQARKIEGDWYLSSDNF